MKVHQIILDNIRKIFKQRENHRNQIILNACRRYHYPLHSIRKALIILNDIDVSALAKQEEISPPRLYDAIKSDKHNGRSKDIIAGILGVKTEDLYPEVVNQ